MAEYTIKAKLVLEGHKECVAGLDEVAAALERVNAAKEKFDILFNAPRLGVKIQAPVHDPVHFEQLAQMLAKNFKE